DGWCRGGNWGHGRALAWPFPGSPNPCCRFVQALADAVRHRLIAQPFLLVAILSYSRANRLAGPVTSRMTIIREITYEEAPACTGCFRFRCTARPGHGQRGRLPD